MSDLINESVTVQLTSGEKRLLDCLYDARDDLRKLMQRWDERLTFEGASLWKEYAKGRISVVCYVHTGACGNCLESAASIHSKRNIGESITVIVMCADTGNLGDADCRDQQSVFVHDIKLVEGPEGIIPSFIWLYDIDDQIADTLPRDLYFSTVDGCYKFLPRVADRKGCVFGGGSACLEDYVVSHDIKRGPQVMNGVAEDERNVIGQRLRIQCEHVLPSRVYIDMKFVEISFEERDKGRIQLVDVVVGPFNL